MHSHNSRVIKLSEILLAFSRAISVTLGMGLFHTMQLAKIAYILGKHLGLTYNQLERLVLSALIHDIGITYIKKDFLKIADTHDADIFKKSDLDIIELLDFAKKNKINELIDLITSHSFEGVHFLKQSSIKHTVFNIINKDSIITKKLFFDSIEETAYLSKILCIADMLECASTIEETLEEKASVANNLVKNFTSQFFDGELGKKIQSIVKEKEFWYAVIKNKLFIDIFSEFNDIEYDLYSDKVLNFFTIFAMFIDIKSPHTAEHSTNVAKISRAIAQHLGFTQEKANLLFYAGLLHDVGKLAISNYILEKKGKLTYEEYSTMKLHPKVTKQILKPLKSIKEIVFWGACHHEKENGSGYPNGLDKHQIPMESKIIAVADVYNALTADRPYRSGMPKKKALEILIQDSELLYNKECIKILEQISNSNII